MSSSWNGSLFLANENLRLIYSGVKELTIILPFANNNLVCEWGEGDRARSAHTDRQSDLALYIQCL